MERSKSSPSTAAPDAPPSLLRTAGQGNISAAARRALAEAEERRRHPPSPLPRETGGRDGPEPVRYGDWEVKGLATDF